MSRTIWTSSVCFIRHPPRRFRGGGSVASIVPDCIRTWSILASVGLHPASRVEALGRRVLGESGLSSMPGKTVPRWAAHGRRTSSSTPHPRQARRRIPATRENVGSGLPRPRVYEHRRRGGPRHALTGLSCAMSTPPSERRRLERELAGLLLELGDLRDKLEASPAGLLGHFRRRRLARQLAGLERRMEELRARWAGLPDGD